MWYTFWDYFIVNLHHTLKARAHAPSYGRPLGRYNWEKRGVTEIKIELKQ